MKAKFLLMTAITLFVGSSHAATFELHCKMNKNATYSQFKGIATFEVSEDNSVEGVLEWATRKNRMSKMEIL